MKMKYLLFGALMLSGAFGVMAQSSLPAPGSGGTYNPGPGPGFGPGPGIGPGPAPIWGSPWGNTVYVPVPVNTNSGTASVVGVGYDAQGVWRTIPMTVQYDYNGVQYDVTVINAWNPWTDSWNYNVDDEAFNTTYFLRGNQYDFYVVLSTGTFYFNL